MMKRIAVVDSAELAETFKEAARAKGFEVVPISPGAALPAGTSSVVMSPDAALAGFDAAIKVADWQEQLLLLLARAIDCREEFAPGSSERLRRHAVRFADALGLSPCERTTLERGALVRDIGKLDIPNEILLKDALLDYEEWETIRKHPLTGADLVTRMDVLADTADIVRYHHECFDGSGYPTGLEGDNIPVLARAMKILDVYCAMTSPRHYREGVSSPAEALQHLRDDSGTRFDPDMVRVFIEAGVNEVP